MNIPFGWRRLAPGMWACNGGVAAKWGTYRWRCWGSGGFRGIHWTLRECDKAIRTRRTK